MAHKHNFAAALVGAVLLAGLSSGPAFAINGRDAVNQCMEQGARDCAFATQADGSIRITTREGQSLSCANANATCAMDYQARRPVQIAQAQTPARTSR